MNRRSRWCRLGSMWWLAQQNVPVGAAATTRTVAVTANAITATVTPVNPAAGTPTGTVEFFDGLGEVP